MTDRWTWHGWSNLKVSLHIGRLPNRKSICLYSQRGSVVNCHAYFRSEHEALLALGVLDELLGGTVPE